MSRNHAAVHAVAREPLGSGAVRRRVTAFAAGCAVSLVAAVARAQYQWPYIDNPARYCPQASTDPILVYPPQLPYAERPAFAAYCQRLRHGASAEELGAKARGAVGAVAWFFGAEGRVWWPFAAMMLGALVLHARRRMQARPQDRVGAIGPALMTAWLLMMSSGVAVFAAVASGLVVREAMLPLPPTVVAAVALLVQGALTATAPRRERERERKRLERELRERGPRGGLLDRLGP